MIARFAFLAGTVLFTGTGHASERIKPISETANQTSPVYVIQRCEDFAYAVRIYAIILEHNPVYGTDYARSEPFARTYDVLDSISSIQGAVGLKRLDPLINMTNDYMQSFGPISVPTMVPYMPLYQADMATCISAFGKSV
jgi:hypothetical protein